MILKSYYGHWSTRAKRYEELRHLNPDQQHQFIYVLYEVGDHRNIRYVGQTRNPQTRFYDHVNGYSAPSVRDWIQAIGQDRLRMKIIYLVHRKIARGVEKGIIEECFNRGFRLLNKNK